MLTTIRVYIALARRFGIRNLLTAAVEARRRGMAKSNRAMCCRLQTDLNENIEKTKGGLLNTGGNTGSLSVVTINLSQLLPDLPPEKLILAEQKLAATDATRRSKAHSIWLSGKSVGTPREIYLRLYAADAKKYRV